LLVFGFVFIEIRLFFGIVCRRFLFFGIAFFRILWHFCCFNLLTTAYWACFLENLLILGLFLRICLPTFLFDFLADFHFIEVSCQRMVALFYGLFTDFWLVFQIYLFILAK